MPQVNFSNNSYLDIQQSVDNLANLVKHYQAVLYHKGELTGNVLCVALSILLKVHGRRSCVRFYYVVFIKVYGNNEDGVHHGPSTGGIG